MKYTIIVLAFIAGLLFCSTYRYQDLVEGFDTQKCPNLLIKKGKELYLLNRSLAQIPGVNPIKFENLEEYSEYLKWQRRAGIRCPILFLEESYDTQDQLHYRVSNNPFSQEIQKLDVMGGTGDIVVGALLDANVTNNNIYNKGSQSAYDPDNQNIGRWTKLDKMFHSQDQFSNNAMDVNWKHEYETKNEVSNNDYKYKKQS
tara:strand:- start:750 stop:1352 length:603 start_codon:yes stop_codon:yes gene_type:complete